MNDLIIVESPTKAKTIKSFLPRAVTIATKGYLKDLPKSSLGLSIENEHFEAKYEFIKGQKKLSAQITEYANKANNIYLAVDDDREGETIAMQVATEALKGYRYTRIVFHEITKSAIMDAIKTGGREIINSRVAAGKTRRITDRLIGYPMSDIISFDFAKNKYPYTPKGIGRIISPSLQILLDNQIRIEEFVPSMYYQIGVDYCVDNTTFRAMLNTRFEENEKNKTDELMVYIRNSDHIVSKYNENTRDVAPFPPLVTSRLVRSGFYLFGFKPKKVMKLAQELYENGLITYMRTDSMLLSDEAVYAIITLLKSIYPPEYYVDKKREYKNADNAQGAHEAIRPTNFDEQHFPKHLLQNYPQLNDEHRQLYEFIFYRTVATQMSDAIYDSSTIEIQIGENLVVNAKANNMIFDGWQKLHGQMLREAERVEGEEWKQRTVILPRCTPSQEIDYVDTQTIESTTKTPGRYGVGRFITEIESFTRPSTLDSIVDKLEESGYIHIRKGMIYLTALGQAVAEWTFDNAKWLTDPDNTRLMETALDMIEENTTDNPDELLHQYFELIEDLKKKVGFIERDFWKPSEGEALLARSIAKKLNLSEAQIDEILKYKKSCREFIERNKTERKRIGSCPACSKKNMKGIVYEYEKSFSCSNFKDGCKFTLWKKSIRAFLDRINIDFNEEYITEAVSKGLTEKPILLENLEGKNGKYNAYLVVEHDINYGWKLGFKFPRNRKKVA